MVGHLNRAPSTEAYLRIANSVAFWNGARSVVLITPDGDESSGQVLVAQRKVNYARLAPIERHVLEEVVLPDTFDPETGQRVVTSRMRFLEVADDVNPSDILDQRSATKTETAETLLEALLADGEWHESGGLRTLLVAAGFNERLAQRAAKELGVEIERRGFPATTCWRLPVATSLGSTNVATVDLAQPSHSSRDTVPVATNKNGAGGVATASLVGSSVDCQKHEKTTTVERMAAGLVYYACGCHVHVGETS
jgi:hypothetical protein